MIISFKRRAFAIVIVLLLTVASVFPFNHIGGRTVPCCLTDRTAWNYIVRDSLKSRSKMCSSAFLASSRYSTQTSSTILSMGIRSIFGLGQRNKEDEPENTSDLRAALEAIKADLEEVRKKELSEMKKKKKKQLNGPIYNSIAKKQITTSPQPVVKPEIVPGRPVKRPTPVYSNSVILSKPSSPPSTLTPTPSPKPITRSTHRMDQPKPKRTAVPVSSSYAETTRDRVKRIKTGVMTEEEKVAFLTNALARQPQGTITAKKGSRTTEGTRNSGSVDRISSLRSKSKTGISSSYRNDPLWNQVIGHPKAKDYGSDLKKYKFGDKVDNDSAKRKYLDMVTDPNRFASYAAMGGQRKPIPIEAEDDDRGEAGYEDKEEVNDKNESLITGGFIDNLKSVLTNEKEKKDTYIDSLAERLQSAAIIQEQQDAEMKMQRELERQKERDRIAEAQKQAAEEIRKREEEKLKRMREEEARLRKEEEERRKAEENRRQAMIVAQEEYWKKQLEKEKKRKEATVITSGDAEESLDTMKESVAKDFAINEIRAQQRDESEVLQKAAADDLFERQRNAEIIEDTVARLSQTVPQHLHEDVSASAFVREQEKKRAELQKLVEEQNARLASLNSPLPPIRDSTFSMPPTPILSAPSSDPIPALSLSELTMKNSEPPSNVSSKTTINNIEPTSDPIPRLSLAELTMKKSPVPPTEVEPEPTSDAESSSSNLSLRETTMLNSSEKSNDVSNSPQERKGPIRQSIPILDQDDDEDDFFEYSRNGNNSNMSIKDIMARNGDSANQDDASAAKQRSKMWGIDIDKFDV